MFSCYSVLNLPPDQDNFELFIKDKGVIRSKIACCGCRISKRKCDRTFPECQACSDKKLRCIYSKQFPTKEKIPKLLNAQPSYHLVTNLPKSQGIFMKHRYTTFNQKEKSKKEPNSLQLTQPWKSKALVKMVLVNSQLDVSDSPMFVSSDGRFEYYGQSPVGPLLANYFDLIPVVNPAQKDAITKMKHNKPSFNLEIQLISEWIIQECLDCFFRNYYPFFPIVDEEYFNRNPTPLLLKLLVGIGCKYLPAGEPLPGLTDHLDREMFIQLKLDFLKAGHDVAVALILIGQYQIVVSEFRRAWLYQSYYNLMMPLLGTNRPSPRHLNHSENYQRMRVHQWWGACIGDKLNTFLLNRPMLIPSGDWNIKYPSLPKLPKLSEIPSDSEYKLGCNQVSFLYLKSLAQICDLMGHAVAFNKFPPDSLQAAHYACQKIFFKFLAAYDVYMSEMDQIELSQPAWLHQMASPLVSFNYQVLHTVIIRLSQYFLRDMSQPLAKYYLHRSLVSAIGIIHSGEALGENFFRYGTVYRYYAISSAILVFAHFINHPQSHPYFPNLVKLASTYISRGLHMLNQSRPYQPIVEEFYVQLATLMKKSS